MYVRPFRRSVVILTTTLSAGQGSTPDANTVDGIVINIKAVVSDTVAQLDAQAQVDLSGVDLTNLGVAVYGLLSVSAFVDLKAWTVE